MNPSTDETLTNSFIDDDREDEFELTMRLRNNLLKRRRLQTGLSVVGLAKRIGIPAHAYRDMENLDRSALYKNGEWKDTALAVAMFFKVSPEVLWPDSVLAVTQPKITKTIGQEKLLALSALQPGLLLGEAPCDPESACLHQDLEMATRRVLHSLSPREEKVVRMRFGIGEKGEHSLAEVGKDFEVSSGRIQQIENKALQKLRKTYCSQHLREFVDDSPSIIWSHLVKNRRLIGFRTQAEAYEVAARHSKPFESVRFGVSLNSEENDVRPLPVEIDRLHTINRVIRYLWHDLIPGRTYFVHWSISADVQRSGVIQITSHAAGRQNKSTKP